MLLSLVGDRLVDQVSFILDAQPAPDMVKALTQSQRVTTVWIFPSARRGQRSPQDNASFSGLHKQNVDRAFGVGFWTRHVGDQFGGNALDAVDTRIDLLDAALCGWRPAASYEPCFFASGKPVRFVAGAVFWVQQYTTEKPLQIAAAA